MKYSATNELWHLPSIYTHDFHLIWITLPSVKLQYVLMDYISVLNCYILAIFGLLEFPAGHNKCYNKSYYDEKHDHSPSSNADDHITRDLHDGCSGC